MRQKMLNGDRMETTDFEKTIKDWEWRWVNAHDVYSSEPSGNLTEIVNKLYKKYAVEIQNN